MNMKRKLSIISFVVLLLFSGTSCTDYLTLKPESEIVLENYWQTESDVESVLAACYRGLTEDAVISRMIVWGELRSDNMVAGTGFPTVRYDMQRILDGNLTPANVYCSWGSFYSVINYCNTLLHYAPTVIARDNNFTVSDLHRIQAEALTIRALCYFYLVRTYKEVPWVSEASISDNQNYNLKKSSEQAVVDSLVSNLLTAQKYARTDFGIKAYNKGRITLDAVNALLADLYLWSGNYNECVNTCNKVLANKNLKLEEANYMFSHVFYLGNSTESIFELQFGEKISNTSIINLYGNIGNTLGNIGFPTTLAYSEYDNTTGEYSPFNFKVSTIYEGAKDIRAKDSYMQYGGKNFIFKYAGIQRTETPTGASSYFYRSNNSNWIIYRLSDVMLMKAEALVELDGTNNMQAAMNLLNTTYLRSNEGQDSLHLINYSTKYDLENLVLRERQREFLFEGKRWFDLVRMARRENTPSSLNTIVEHKATGNSVSVGAAVLDAMYMPISRGELDANSNLKQNPYYEETSSSSSR